MTAVNRGGESFPSEILSAYKAKREQEKVIIINGLTESAVRRSLILLKGQDSIYHKIPESRIYQTFRFAEHKQASTVHKPEKKEKAVWDIAETS